MASLGKFSPQLVVESDKVMNGLNIANDKQFYAQAVYEYATEVSQLATPANLWRLPFFLLDARLEALPSFTLK